MFVLDESIFGMGSTNKNDIVERLNDAEKHGYKGEIIEKKLNGILFYFAKMERKYELDRMIRFYESQISSNETCIKDYKTAISELVQKRELLEEEREG